MQTVHASANVLLEQNRYLVVQQIQILGRAPLPVARRLQVRLCDAPIEYYHEN